jgi:tetratricopeptide (TPR) repeat protein
MTGMYAYQCGNFATALHCFDNLNLQSAEIEKVENILYWTADIYLQIRDYDNALTTLDKLLKYKKSDMIDDALVKKGLMYKKLGSIDLAMNTFKKVVVGHPESEYSRLAALEIKRGEMSFQ